MNVLTSNIGTRPNPLTLEHERWFTRGCNFLLNYCPLARTTTYYFDSGAADDSGNGLTTATPKKTVAAARTILAAATAGASIAALWKRGSKFTDAPVSGNLLAVTNTNIVGFTMADWWDAATRRLPRPLFTGFTSIGGGWTNAAGNRYTKAMANPGAIRFRWGGVAQPTGNNLYSPECFVRVTSAAEVEAKTTSFWHDGTLCHMQVGPGINPNDWPPFIEYAPTAVNNFLRVDGIANVRVENIDHEGIGINDSSQSYGIYIGQPDTTPGQSMAAAVVNCQSLYNGYHSFGHVGRGACLFDSCRGGLCSNVSGTTVFVSFNVNGLGETLVRNPRVWGGYMPQGVGAFDKDGYHVGQAMYSHTASAAFQQLILVRGMNIEGYKYSPASGTTLNGLDPVTDPRVATGVIMDEYILGYQQSSGDIAGGPGVLRLNCIDEIKSLDNGSGSHGYAFENDGPSWNVNCVLIADPSDFGGFTEPAIYGAGTFTSAGEIWNHHCRIVLKGVFRFASAGFLALTVDPGTSAPLLRMTNSEFAVYGQQSAAGLNLINASTHINGNVVCGLTVKTGNTGASRGYDNDPNYIEDHVADDPYTPPRVGQASAGSAIANAWPYGPVEFDLFWNQRFTVTSRGPLEVDGGVREVVSVS